MRVGATHTHKIAKWFYTSLLCVFSYCFTSMSPGNNQTLYNSLHSVNFTVMEWSGGQRTGHRQRSQSKSETTAGRGSNQVLLYSSRQFSATHKILTCIDKRAAWAARKACYCNNQIGPLVHKMADNCVSLAHTNTVSSTITKLIKSLKKKKKKS